MSFDQRLHRRIPFSGNVRFWPDAEKPAFGTLGDALNLSESGLAFTSEKSIQKGERLQVQFRIPNPSGYLRLLSQVVHCEGRTAEGVNDWHLRVRFLERHREELAPMRRFILQTADPKLAAATGWGKILVPGLPCVVAQYRDLHPDQFNRWIEDHSFLAAHELADLPRFQECLAVALGSKTPGRLHLQGNRRPLEKSKLWLELSLPKGSLRLVAATILSQQKPREDADIKLLVLACNKEDATRLHKKT